MDILPGQDAAYYFPIVLPRMTNKIMIGMRYLIILGGTMEWGNGPAGRMEFNRRHIDEAKRKLHLDKDNLSKQKMNNNIEHSPIENHIRKVSQSSTIHETKEGKCFDKTCTDCKQEGNLEEPTEEREPSDDKKETSLAKEEGTDEDEEMLATRLEQSRTVQLDILSTHLYIEGNR